MKFSKLILAASVCFCTLAANAQRTVTVPANTMLVCELAGTITLNDKPGTEVKMKVQKEVSIDGVVVIAKDAVVNATIRQNTRPKARYYSQDDATGQLLIDLNSVQAVDGSSINLNSCYFQRYAELNTNWFDKERKWVLPEGSIKNCNTSVKVTVKVP